METRRATSLTALAALTALAIGGCTSTDPGVRVESATRSAGVTDSTDPIPFDDEVRTGTLANGLTYYIRHSDRPGRKAELRLAIDAGSALEDDDQSAVAHFLEHMLFNGTEKYEKNELIEVLQQGGVEFGADINAYTSYDETVYQLTVDSDNDEFALGLDILHQWLTAATLTPADVASERGVVLDEYRTRELTADGRVFSELESIFLGGTAYDGRAPIGAPEAIEAMTPTLLRRFYDAWYRPDNAAVIVVGDIDLDDVEDDIEALFGDVESRGDNPERVVLDWTGTGASRAAVITDPDLIEGNVELALPAQNPVRDTVGLHAAELVDYIATAAIGNRLESDIGGGEAPFNEAYASSSSYVRALDAPSVYMSAANDEVGAASAALLDEFARVVQFGLSEADVARVVTELRATVDTTYEQRDTIQAAFYADRLVSYHLQGRPFPSAQDQYDLDTVLLDVMNAQLVNDAFLSRLASAPPVLVLAAKEGTSGLPDEAELAAELSSLATRSVTPRAEAEVVGDLLMAAPEPAEVVRQDEIDGVPGAFITPTEVEFANGVRVIINPSHIYDDYILMYGVSQGGMSVTPTNDAAAAWLMNEVNSESGFGSLSRDAVQQILGASTVDLFPYVSDTTEFIGGSSSPGDLELAFQVLNQYMSASNFDQAALDNAVERNLSYLVDIAADPDLAVQIEMNDARYGDDPRRRIVLSEEELTSITTADLARVWNERYGNAGDFVFILSGDLDVDATIDLAARYLGTLPSTGESETAIATAAEPPPGVEQRTVLAGTGEQASLAVLYTTPAKETAREAVLAGLLTTVLNNRLTKAIREELGATYSPSAYVSVSTGPSAEVTVNISISGAPDGIEDISAALQANLDDLRQAGPTDDEFSAAIAEANDAFSYISDEQIVGLIESWLTDKDAFSDYENQATLIKKVTQDELRTFAAQVMPPLHYIEIKQLPR